MNLRNRILVPLFFRCPLLLLWLVLVGQPLIPAVVQAQNPSTTMVTISNSVAIPNMDRPGINLGGLAPYGPQQLLKSLNYANGGYMPGTYAQTSYACSAGGTNSTTSWYNNITNASGYPANFWTGASFLAINAADGTAYGSGTITASTASTGGAGITFTLSPALSSACSPSQNDVLIVRLLTGNEVLSPSQVNAGFCAGSTWNTADTSPASTNTQHSLEMPNGCSASFIIDAVLRNATNTNPVLASQSVPWINLNGSYTATFKAKCLSSGCSMTYSLGRVSGVSYIAPTTVDPSYNSATGAGWTTYTKDFTASETGSQASGLAFAIVCNGTCLMQDADVIEGSTLPGNTTVFRDAVVEELQKIHPGSLRYMDGTQWCSDVDDEIAATGNRRWCLGNEYLPVAYGPPLGYNDVLALAQLIGADAFLSVGVFNQPADWTKLVNWLNSSGWTAAYAAAGHRIYLEDGNEAWNTGAPSSLYEGNGLAYGYTMGLNMAAARAAAGYNSSVIRLVSDSWAAGEQGYGSYGWLALSMQGAGCRLGAAASCPDFVDDAPYLLNYLGAYDASGGNVATTGAPFLDEWAEIANIDSAASPPAHATSMMLNQQYAKSVYGLNTSVYEVNESTTAGIAVTQQQLDQIDASVGQALTVVQHALLMARDAQVTGPIHIFTLAEPYNSYNGSMVPVVMPLWGTSIAMATGPGQTPGSANFDRPLAVALQVVNNAIGANSNLMSIQQTGTPTFSYPGGQPQASANTIAANAAVPEVNCFAYADAAQIHWTTICFNNNLSAPEAVVFGGAGAPAGSVQQTIFPSAGNWITDHNENSYIGPSSLAPVVVAPSSNTTCSTSFSIPPASMIVLTYSVGGSSTLATPTFSPAAGTYSSAQNVSIDLPAGTTGCVGINTLPASSPPGTCAAGSAPYLGPIAVATSETINAIATEAGCSDSDIGTAAYVITAPAVATPIFAPVSGTYTAPQSITISDATSGAVIHYTTDGSTPTASSPVYSGPIAVSSSETLEAIAVESGYTDSPVAVATYTIQIPQVATPTFSPASGTYTAPQSITLSDTTSGAVIHYTTNGSTPTAASPVYSGPIAVSTSETLEAIAIETGYTDSSVAVATYTIQIPQVATPTFSPASGTYTAPQSITLSDATSGAVIHYTTNGSTPTASSPVYSGPIAVPTSETLEAIAIESGYTDSPVAVATYTIQIPQVATPTFSPASGTYTAPQSVTLSDATPGATIFYTTDNSTPTTQSMVFTAPLDVTRSETIEAIASTTSPAGNGAGSTSAVGIATYTLNAPAPSFTIGVTPTSLSLTRGQTGTATVTINPENSFAAPITFSCSGLPSSSSCSFSPAIVTPSGSTARTTMTIATAPEGAALQRNPLPFVPASSLAIALWGLRSKKKRRSLLPIFAAFSLCVLTACSVQIGQESQTSAPTVSTVTITAASGSLQQTAILSLSLQ